jgi:hypothetical protein
MVPKKHKGFGMSNMPFLGQSKWTFVRDPRGVQKPEV